MSPLKSLYRRVRRRVRGESKAAIRQKMFFLHVPKCAGTSLTPAICDAYRTHDPVKDKGIVQLNTVGAFRASQLLGRDLLDYSSEMMLYYLSIPRARCVYGHFTFNEKAFEEFGREFAFVTFLREPVAKWISLYFFNRYKKGDHFKLEDELEDFVDSPTGAGYGQDYVMQFVGDRQGVDFTSPEAIQRAIANLEKFHLVGVLERMDTFLDEFEQLFGARLSVAQRNVNPVSREERDRQLTPEIMDKIREICRPNQQIYDHVVRELVGHYGERRSRAG
jgi:hypothetical protein